MTSIYHDKNHFIKKKSEYNLVNWSVDNKVSSYKPKERSRQKTIVINTKFWMNI